MAKASSLVFIIGMPITLAATSMSRTAMKARPVSLRIRFLASSAITTTTPRVRRYFACGVAGALYAYTYLGTVEPEAFTLDLSFRVLFMIIIGGVGSILGSFLGAAFITLFPIFLNRSSEWLAAVVGVEISHAAVSNLEFIIFGGLIIFFLIVEPYGLARLWQIAKEKRLWPFPH